jgi:hypothetical protein
VGSGVPVLKIRDLLINVNKNGCGDAHFSGTFEKLNIGFGKNCVTFRTKQQIFGAKPPGDLSA